MFREFVEIRRSFRWSRKILLSDLRGLPPSALDWKVRPDSVTIGSTLIHIAAIEYSVTTALIERRPPKEEWNTPMWKILRPGFHRKFPKEVSTEQSLQSLLRILEDVRRRFRETLVRMTDFRMDETVEWYEDDHELEDERFRTYTLRELLYRLIGHEQYHRGQLTFLKYLARRSHNRLRA